MIWVGIDPGTHTGIAFWDSDKGKFTDLETLPIHKALAMVEERAKEGKIFVVFEDARQRTWFGSDRPTNAKLQGAGSIKRDCTIWEDFLTDKRIPFRAIPPIKGGTKLSSEYFRMLTKYRGKTSNHARDAGMLVFGK